MATITILDDDSDNVVVSQENGQWGNEVWAPRVMRAGFAFWATVAPEKVIGQMQMREFQDEYRERGVTVEMLAAVDEALAWLRSKD